MKTTALLILGLLLSTAASAKSLCEMNARDFQNRLKSESNRLAFQNPAGPMKIGVCWWHSRMQRNANYLFEGSISAPDILFSPVADPLTRDQTMKMVRQMISQDDIVQTKGYRNLYSFSSAHADVVAEALGNWQISDSVFGFGWTRGLRSPSVSPAALTDTMETALRKVRQGQIVFQMLKFSGLETHAWLLFDSVQDAAGNMKFAAIDSNYPISTYTPEFMVANADLITHLPSPMSPDTQRESELQDSFKTVIKACRKLGQRSPLEAEYKRVMN